MTLSKDHWSVVFQHFFKDFSYENTGPVLIKFHMQPPGKMCVCVCIPILVTTRDDQIFIEGTCPGQVTYKNPFVLMNFELVR